MAISTNGTIIARLAGGLYNTVLSNATYLEVVAQDPSALANKLYAADFGKKTDAEVGKTLVTNLGLASLTGLDAWVAAQLTAAGANKGAKVVELLNGFAQMTADTTYGTYATAFNAKVDAALAASQKDGNAEGKFETAGVTAPVTSFTLTTGVDAIVGSAGDDTITAPNTVAATGADQTTINAGDSVDGGLGNDTLTMTFGGLYNTKNLVSIKGVENIVYVGVDNLASGGADYAAAAAAKAVTAAALKTAIAAKVASTAAATAAATAKTAADTVAAASTAGSESTTTKVATTGAYAVALAGSTASGNSTALKAAYKAALTSPSGAALATDNEVALRADVLAADAAKAKTAADNLDASTSASGAPKTTAELETEAYAADAAAAAKLSGLAAVLGSVTIAANAEATSISIDGTSTTVSGLTDAQTVTMSGTSIANTASTAATATTANVKLASATGSVNFTGSNPLTTANVTGSVKAGTAGTDSGAAPGTITLKERDGSTAADTITTLKLGITSDATVTVTDLTAVTTIDASASTGGLTLSPLDKTLNVTTGAGADTVTFIAATDSADAKKLTSSLSTGAGNDKITVQVSGTGTSTVNAGAGDDTVTMKSALGTAVVDGGDGKDTLAFDATLIQTSFSTGGYNSLKANALNFEVLSLAGKASTVSSGTESVAGAGATVDASKAAQFTEFTFNQAANTDATITKVADAQTVNAQSDVSVTAAGYVAKGTADANGDTALSTAYAGTLAIVAKGEGQKFTSPLAGTTTDNANLDVSAFSSALNLTASTKGSTSNGVTTYTATTVVLTGDVKTATITVNNSANNSKLNTGDVASKVTFAPTDADTSGAFTNLGNLTSVTLAGTGSVVIDNSDTKVNSTTTYNTNSGSKLATIDASGLAGKLTYPTATTGAVGTTVGSATAGLDLTAGVVAENVKLGSALDTLRFPAKAAFTSSVLSTAGSSTYAKMDSITGLSLVADAGGTLVAALSDNITGSGVTGTYVSKTTGVSGSLDSALIAAGTAVVAGTSTATDLVVFQNGGNTYIYQDVGANGLDDNDVVIELVGLVDLTLLIQDLAA